MRAQDLARVFEVTERTIYRDMAALSESGVPVVALPGEGYELAEGFCQQTRVAFQVSPPCMIHAATSAFRSIFAPIVSPHVLCYTALNKFKVGVAAVDTHFDTRNPCSTSRS